MRAVIIVPSDRSMTREQWKYLDRTGRTIMRAAKERLERATRDLAIYGKATVHVEKRVIEETRKVAEKAAATLVAPPVLSLDGRY